MIKAYFKTVNSPVILELDSEGAQFLADITYRVGGDKSTSRRRIADAINDVLKTVGYTSALGNMSGNIICE